MTIQWRLLLHWVFCAWGVFYLLDGCAWLPSRYEVSHAGSLPSTAPPAVQDAGGHLSVRHREDLLGHAAGDAASAAHLRQFVDAEQRLSGRPLVAGNRVTLLVDGPATYQAVFDAMRVATDHIHLEAYELADDQIGQALADLVLARRAAGVHVKILYDSLGSRGSSAAYFERLRMGGVLVQEFHPVNPAKDLRVWHVIARDHRKLLIVDGKVAFTGGINFSRVYARGSSASTARAQDTARGWRDTTVRIEGPAVAECQQLFLQNWTQGEPQQAWLENNFQQDLRHARCITLRQWQTRSLGERLMETLSLLFQYWF